MRTGGRLRRRRPPPLLQNGVLLLVAIVVLGAAAFEVGKQRAGGGQDAGPEGSRRAVTSLWFGDSIVAGVGRSSADVPDMAQVASKAAGWGRPDVRGFGGTGYLRSSTSNGVFRPSYPNNIGKQLPPGSAYDVVVIAGGNNDGDIITQLDRFRAAVRSTLDQVRQDLPKAKIVVVGPYSPTGTGDAEARLIERQEAERLGLPFIDGIGEGWFLHRPELISSDGVHPNDEGYTVLGRRLGADLKKLKL